MKYVTYNQFTVEILAPKKLSKKGRHHLLMTNKAIASWMEACLKEPYSLAGVPVKVRVT